MSLRMKILAASLAMLIPVFGLGLEFRHEVRDRLTNQYGLRIETQVAVIQQELKEENRELAQKLAALSARISQDNRFRLAVVDEMPEHQGYLQDYAAGAMSLTGLSMLQIQDSSGRILSSGHFRNAYDTQDSSLPRELARVSEGFALTHVRKPDGEVAVLARIDSVHMGRETLTIVGGVLAQRSFLAGLAPNDELAVSWVYPGGVRSSDEVFQNLLSANAVHDPSAISRAGYMVEEVPVPLLLRDPGSGEVAPGTARLLVTHHLGPLRDLHRWLNGWILAALLLTVLLGLVLALWLSHRVSKPINELAKMTGSIDLNRLDMEFPVHRRDEVGVLARFLTSMTQSLGTSAFQLRDAERRATLGEVARQVNHDVKNGLIPIRNVLRHLNQVSAEEPASLSKVFRERKGTLDASMTYLERLAENYARLSPVTSSRECDLNAIVQQVAAAMTGSPARVEPKLAESVPPVWADPISLRRILENLVQNAVQNCPSKGGKVSIFTESVMEDGILTSRVTVEDNGPGISEEELSRIFDDFYTTKERGIGLGLSIVRRLVSDNDGSIRAESSPGRGSRFTVDFPGRQGRKPVASGNGKGEER